MSKKLQNLIYFIYTVIFAFISNCYVLLTRKPIILAAVIPLFLVIFGLSGLFVCRVRSKMLRICNHGGVTLLVFIWSALISVLVHIALALTLLPQNPKVFIFSAVYCIAFHFVLFWDGIICVYLTSVQLGVKQRVVGALCGFIPIVNIIVLGKIIKTVLDEVEYEGQKQLLNRTRQTQRLCATKYPILLVHGVFFRDNSFFNYWGRIPKELEQNGAVIYYGKHESAASIADSADELCHRIKRIIQKSGCEKLNIIAHSKGGLDCRYAIEHLGIGDCVASLTTVNTPHRGCEFADYLLNRISPEIKNKVADTYNRALKRLGDESPDFLAAVGNLTASYCEMLDKGMKTPDGVFCQSIGSVLKKSKSGKFPLNFSYHLVKYFDGKNDGLVGEQSFSWGEKYTLVTNNKKQGVSHGDIIDLYRTNIDGFDVREFYVQLVNDLKNRGL